MVDYATEKKVDLRRDEIYEMLQRDDRVMPHRLHVAPAFWPQVDYLLACLTAREEWRMLYGIDETGASDGH